MFLVVHLASALLTLTVCRLLRFGLEAWLALTYSARIMSWLESDLFHDIVMFFVAAAIALTVASLVQVVRATRKPATT